MPLSIVTNMAALRAQRTLASTTDALDRVIARLASGQRIMGSADDPGGFAISAQLKNTIALSNQAMRNTTDVISALHTADDSLGAITYILHRIAELAEQSATGTYTNRNRSVIEMEVQALGSEIERIATTTQFNNIKLLSGANTITLQVGFDALSTSRITVGGMQGTLESMRLANAGSSQFNHTVLGPDEATARFNSQTLLTAALNAMEIVGQARGNLGANESRLSSALDMLGAQRQNLTAANSRIQDADVATDVANMIRLQVLQQAAAAALSHANLQPQMVKSLLQQI